MLNIYHTHTNDVIYNTFSQRKLAKNCEKEQQRVAVGPETRISYLFNKQRATLHMQPASNCSCRAAAAAVTVAAAAKSTVYSQANLLIKNYYGIN